MLRRLKALWAWWKPKAHAIGVFQTKLVLTLFYVLAFAPFALAARVLGFWRRSAAKDSPGGWLSRETRDRTLADLRRQS